MRHPVDDIPTTTIPTMYYDPSFSPLIEEDLPQEREKESSSLSIVPVSLPSLHHIGIVDLPGLNAHESHGHQFIVKEFLKRVDSCIYVTDVHQVLSENDVHTLEYIHSLKRDKDLCVLINKCDAIASNDQVTRTSLSLSLSLSPIPSRFSSPQSKPFSISNRFPPKREPEIFKKFKAYRKDAKRKNKLNFPKNSQKRKKKYTKLSKIREYLSSKTNIPISNIFNISAIHTSLFDWQSFLDFLNSRHENWNFMETTKILTVLNTMDLYYISPKKEDYSSHFNMHFKDKEGLESIINKHLGENLKEIIISEDIKESIKQTLKSSVSDVRRDISRYGTLFPPPHAKGYACEAGKTLLQRAVR